MTGARAIYKYDAAVRDADLVLQLPNGAEVLCVQMQAGVPRIWALVNPGALAFPRRFRWHGTGHPVDPAANLEHIGTVQDLGGALVFHLFEVRP